MQARPALALMMMLSVGCSPGEESGAALPDIVGSWRLVGWTVADGVPRCSEEEGGAEGQIVYARDGHMSAQLGCARMPMGDLGAMTATQAVGRVSRRHFSYYGTWVIDEAARTVTHHVTGSSAESWVGTDRVREFTFEGPDRIVLSTAESDNVLVWERNRPGAPATE